MKFKQLNIIQLLIYVNVAFFVIQILTGGPNGWFTREFMLVSSDVYSRPWILLTSMFLHGGIFHLLFNMYALLIFGSLVEQRIGVKRFLLIYFISGILSGFIPNYHAALGASGAIMGIIGVVIMLLPHLKVGLFFFIPMSMRTAGIIFALIDFFGMISPTTTGIAHFSHLIGLGCGILYGYILLRQKKKFTKKFLKKSENKRHFKSKSTKTIELDEEDVKEYLRYGKI